MEVVVNFLYKIYMFFIYKTKNSQKVPVQMIERASYESMTPTEDAESCGFFYSEDLREENYLKS